MPNLAVLYPVLRLGFLSGRNPINLAIPKRKSLRGLGGTFDGCTVLNALAFSLRDYGFKFSAEIEQFLN